MLERIHIIDIAYMLAAVMLIFSLKMMGRVSTARRGGFLAAFGMLIAVAVTLIDREIVNYQMMLAAVVIGSVIGAVSSKVVKMTSMPQMVAIFNGLGGLASALVAASEFLKSGPELGTFALGAIVLGSFVGSLTFAGSAIAYAKLEGILEQQPITYPLQKTLNLILAIAVLVLGVLFVMGPSWALAFWLVLGISALLGVLLVLPIGGADMPVVISLLNSYSGVAAAITGFVLLNKVLIVAGSLVGATGLILTQIMCKAMNRSLANVAFGTFGKIDKEEGSSGQQDYIGVKSCTAEEAALMMENAQSVIIVPGYGLAVSRAQHAIKELADMLEELGAKVTYAIHPVAGRMPGHMNVLLAEADIPYEQLVEMDHINHDFEHTDVVLVVGANDVVNPVARNQKGSPIYGMPILNVDKAKSIIVMKRSLSPGFAGIKNPLFENEKTMMFFDDAKAAIESTAKELKELART